MEKGEAGGEKAKKGHGSPKGTQVSIAPLFTLVYACFVPSRSSAAEGPGFSFQACVPEPSLVPSTQ